MNLAARCGLAAAGVAAALTALLASRGEPNAAGPAPAHEAPALPCALGINLAALEYYATEYPFADAFKLSAPFLHQSQGHWSLDEPLDLRPDGYPARLAPGHWAGTLVFRDISARFPAGDYVLQYDGQGAIEADFAATVTARAPGRLTLSVTPQNGGIYLKITETDPGDPVRNVRLWMPGIDPDHPPLFHPAFLARWRGFAVLRFMDWMRTNDSPVATWDDRTRPDAQTQATPRGVAPEYIAALCNELGADAWVCLPHRADDGYVRGLAALLHRDLAPERKAWIEYSNETWNGQFGQAQWCQQRGKALGLSRDGYQAQLRYHAQRACEVFALFEAEFGGHERLVRVLAAQSANPATAEEILSWHGAAAHADALAIAPYFGIDVGGEVRGRAVEALGLDGVLAQCSRDIERTLRDAAAHCDIAARHRVALVAYEGGQHLVGHGGAENLDALTELFFAANRSARMGELYARYLEGWRAIGGGPLCAFHSTSAWSKWGSWGHCEDYQLGSEQMPKYRALRAFLATPH